MSTEKWDTAEIAAYLGVTRESAAKIAREPDFPVPVINVGRIRRWDRGQVEVWAATPRTPAQLSAMDALPTALYRHFDAAGTLLYVGISLGPITRLSNHCAYSHWARSITTVRIAWFDDRAAALAAEAEAIRTEAPAHNIAGVAEAA